MSAYIDREQTQAKHYILRRYLQELAFKVLHGWDITYVDGFSGPWESQEKDFSDTSFMIAIAVLKDAQNRIFEQTGLRRKVRCFFSEKDPKAYEQLAAAVAPHHKASEQFEVTTYRGKFEDAIPEIQGVVDSSFPLVFIDPTGWTGYPFEKIKPLFARPKCEVLINFMYDFVNRAVAMPDEKTITSLDPILGGPGWRDRLDASLPRGRAVEALFRKTLKAVGRFEFVVSTKIDKGTVDRPHFYIAYATKSRDGLKAFRQTEYDALRQHVRNRAMAKERKREEKSGTVDMFAGAQADVQEASFDDIIDGQKKLASESLLKLLAENGPQRFSAIVDFLLPEYMLRETNVKDICVDLAHLGRIENSWGGGKHKPKDESLIRLV